MKHCYPSSDIVTDTGNPNPASTVQSIENYKAIYRLLRNKFDAHPDKIFIIWTLPPRNHAETTHTDAQRATDFSNWLKTDFLTENGSHPNIFVWDFRSIVMDSNQSSDFYNCLRSDYATGTDSHPNSTANNIAGPLFAQFIVNSMNSSPDNHPNISLPSVTAAVGEIKGFPAQLTNPTQGASITALQFDITYDPNILQYNSYSLGTAVSPAQKQVSLGTGTPPPARRFVVYGVNKNVVNNGSLVTVYLKANGAGQSPVTISNVVASDANANAVPVDIQSGSIAVQ